MAKPLFIPLIAEYYDAFKNGTKRQEYRLYGDRWNERVCYPGRAAVLSRGYGKANRLSCFVESFDRKQRCDLPPDIAEVVEYVYKGTTGDVAIITVTEPSDKPHLKFRPSNGTAGDAFEVDYCNRCQKMDRKTGDPLVDLGCKIHALVMAFDVNDLRYPYEWIYGIDGKPTCTAFLDVNDKAPGPTKPRCNKTPDMFS